MECSRLSSSRANCAPNREENEYMSFFNPIGISRASNSLEQWDDFLDDMQNDPSEDETFSSDDFED